MSYCEHDCLRDATHTVKLGEVTLRLCGPCALEVLARAEEENRRIRRRRFWVKVMLTPVYPFIWSE